MSFVLAAEKTHRKDPLDALRYYTGGWNISNEHYWAVSPSSFRIRSILSFVAPLSSTIPGFLIDFVVDFRGAISVPQSVGFTAAPVFAAAGVWFVVFGIALFLAGCCFCCCPGGGASDSYSRACLVVSLLLLLVATAAAA